MTNWNYKELGFDSEEEMKASIKKAERKLDMNATELMQAEHKERQERANKGFSFEGIDEGVRKERLDDEVLYRLRAERDREMAIKKQQETQAIFDGIGQAIKKQKENEAKQEFEERKAKAEAELRAELNIKHNVNMQTEEERQRDESLKDMLKNLIK